MSVKTENYNNYVERWSRWWKREGEYWEKRREFVERDASDEEFRELDIEYDKAGPNSEYFGPYTIIDDPRDLLNPNFILPGMDSSFLSLTNTDRRIPEYFGKRIYSEIENISGIVIGYGYDAGDDYIIIRDDFGKEHHIIVNSHYYEV